uniref:Uncharacterized protein n=1 Tax=Octopus bimaculoides TaxID=37653 RepID=A0A0L8FJ30_OCTBM|eukprot:XP_014789360.1 PREDICTED: uncharacterized protein LOC106883013 [Octopus bimaculoides]
MSSETGGTAVSSAAGISRVESSSTVREDNTNNTSVDSTGPHADTQKQPQGKNVIEHQEEAKLKAKYPNLQIKGGGSALLQKRLQRGVSICHCSFHTHTILVFRNVSFDV